MMSIGSDFEDDESFSLNDSQSPAQTTVRRYKKAATPRTKTRILEAARNQEDWIDIARRYDISESTVRKWMRTWDFTVKKRGGGQYSRKMNEDHIQFAVECVEATPSITNREIILQRLQT